MSEVLYIIYNETELYPILFPLDVAEGSVDPPKIHLPFFLAKITLMWALLDFSVVF